MPLDRSSIRHILKNGALFQALTARGIEISLGASHQELASQIGTVRELVSRNMARLQAQGFIEISGREVTILDSAGLEGELSLMV